MDTTSIHVQKAAAGISDSFGWVISRFDPLLRSQIRHRLGRMTTVHEIDDVAAEVWLVAVKKIGDLQPRDGHYGPVLAKFLSTTAIHHCNNLLRCQIRARQRGGGAVVSREGDCRSPHRCPASTSRLGTGFCPLASRRRTDQGERRKRISTHLLARGCESDWPVKRTETGARATLSVIFSQGKVVALSSKLVGGSEMDIVSRVDVAKARSLASEMFERDLGMPADRARVDRLVVVPVGEGERSSRSLAWITEVDSDQLDAEGVPVKWRYAVRADRLYADSATQVPHKWNRIHKADISGMLLLTVIALSMLRFSR